MREGHFYERSVIHLEDQPCHVKWNAVCTHSQKITWWIVRPTSKTRIVFDFLTQKLDYANELIKHCPTCRKSGSYSAAMLFNLLLNLNINT